MPVLPAFASLSRMSRPASLVPVSPARLESSAYSIFHPAFIP